MSLEDGLDSMVRYIKKRGVSKFNRHIPVEIIYRTAFFDKFGQVQFRSDIYGRDALVYICLLYTSDAADE